MRERLMAENRQKYQKVKKVGIMNSHTFEMRNICDWNIVRNVTHAIGKYHENKLENIVRNKFHQNYCNRQT